jgi:flagellar motor switch protein FliM
MEKQLQQGDIDALFASARKKASGEVEAPKANLGDKAELYNFSNAGQINSDQMRAISTVNDMFARNLTHNLGAWLRTVFLVNLVSAEQLTYSEFLTRVPELSYVCTARLEPSGALAVLELDLTLAAPVIDLLLGGVGRASSVRELTEIEESILTSVMEIICRELSVAWQPVGLTVQFEKRIPTVQSSRVAPLSEKTLCVSFEIRMPEAQGMLNISFPAVISNLILRRLMRMDDKSRRSQKAAKERLLNLLGKSKTGTSLQLPTMPLRTSTIAKLQPGQVLRLPVSRNTPVDFRVMGLSLFDAIPVRMGDHRAAKLTAVREYRNDTGTAPAQNRMP